MSYENQKVGSIEELKGVNAGARAGEVTDSMREAYMQAAMQKAGGSAEDIDMAAAAQAAATQQAAAQQATAEQSQNEALTTALGKTEGAEKQQHTTSLLQGSSNQAALYNMIDLGIKAGKENPESAKNNLNDSARVAIMQETMQKANDKSPATNSQSQKDMENVSQGTSAIADAKKDVTSSTNETQKTDVTSAGPSSSVEGKSMGLAAGVRIEEANNLDKSQSTTELLRGSVDQVALYNQIDLAMSQGSEAAVSASSQAEDAS